MKYSLISTTNLPKAISEHVLNRHEKVLYSLYGYELYYDEYPQMRSFGYEEYMIFTEIRIIYVEIGEEGDVAVKAAYNRSISEYEIKKNSLSVKTREGTKFTVHVEDNIDVFDIITEISAYWAKEIQKK